MKQQYRELVESIIEQEKKLQIARQMKLNAESELAKCNDYVDQNVAILSEYESKLASLEFQLFVSEAQSVC